MVPIPTSDSTTDQPARLGAGSNPEAAHASLGSPHSLVSLAPLPRRRKVFFGALASSKSALELELIEHAVLGVDEHGVIAFKHDVGPRVHELAAMAAPSSPDLAMSPEAASLNPVFSPPSRSPADAALGTSYCNETLRIRHSPVTATEMAAEKARTYGWDSASYDVVYLGHGDFLMPGLVDTHTVRTPRLPM